MPNRAKVEGSGTRAVVVFQFAVLVIVPELLIRL
jgi:hypothetical protein